jgi:predicted kinase
MIKLSEIILEQTGRPKVIVMAGGAGAGKTYLLNQLSLSSLPQVNPDKYIEDPDHPAYNNLGQGARLADKEAEDLADKGTSFVWDTTASNPKKVQSLINKGYDVFMVMVYTHPMISYISNFSRADRNVPASAVFSTWRNVYQLIADYDKITNGNLAIHVSDRGGKYSKEIEAFNTAAKNGPSGIEDYLKRYNEENGIGGSSFRKPVKLTTQEEEEFKKHIGSLDYDKNNYSEDRALKKAFKDAYDKNGVGPGQDKMKEVLKKYRDRKAKQDERETAVLDNIADMLFNEKFQNLLQHSTPKEIDSKVQAFLA